MKFPYKQFRCWMLLCRPLFVHTHTHTHTHNNLLECLVLDILINIFLLLSFRSHMSFLCIWMILFVFKLGYRYEFDIWFLSNSHRFIYMENSHSPCYIVNWMPTMVVTVHLLVADISLAEQQNKVQICGLHNLLLLKILHEWSSV